MLDKRAYKIIALSDEEFSSTYEIDLNLLTRSLIN